MEYTDSDTEFEDAELFSFADTFSEDILDLYLEIKEVFESCGYPLLRDVTSADFGGLCEVLWSSDRKRPYDARDQSTPWYLDQEEVPLATRSRSFEAWCMGNADIIRSSYAVVADNLLDPCRGYSDGYMETWARFLYERNVNLSRPHILPPPSSRISFEGPEATR